MGPGTLSEELNHIYNFGEEWETQSEDREEESCCQDCNAACRERRAAK